jgi:hypothetical protein
MCNVLIVIYVLVSSFFLHRTPQLPAAISTLQGLISGPPLNAEMRSSVVAAAWRVAHGLHGGSGGNGNGSGGGSGGGDGGGGSDGDVGEVSATIGGDDGSGDGGGSDDSGGGGGSHLASALDWYRLIEPLLQDVDDDAAAASLNVSMSLAQ